MQISNNIKPAKNNLIIPVKSKESFACKAFHNNQGNNLPAMNVLNHYKATNKINFQANNPVGNYEKLFSGLDLSVDNKTFINDFYPKMVKFMHLENVAPKSLTIVPCGDFSGYFDEPTGEILINNEYLDFEKNKGTIMRTIAHELTHLKQYAILYKALGDEQYAELLSDNETILKEYNDKLKIIETSNFENSDEIKDKLKPHILKEIQKSPVYNKIKKNMRLSKKDIKKVEIYKKAVLEYVDCDENYEKYMNNALEVEAYNNGNSIKSAFNKTTCSFARL